MMGHKETVLGDKELSSLIWIPDGELLDGNYSHVAKAVAEAQAKATWPVAEEAGYQRCAKEVVESLNKQGTVWVDKHYTIIEAIEKMTRTFRKKNGL